MMRTDQAYVGRSSRIDDVEAAGSTTSKQQGQRKERGHSHEDASQKPYSPFPGAGSQR
jgi:hypothetical protein